MGRQLARRRWRHRPHQAARTNHLCVLAERLFIARRSRRGGNFGRRIADASTDIAKGQKASLAIRASTTGCQTSAVPRDLSRPVGADRAQRRRRTEHELSTARQGTPGPPQYDRAPVMNMPAPILTTTAALVFRLNLQWHNHVLRSATHFDASPCRWPMGNRVGSAEHFVNPDRVEMSGFT